MKKNILILPFDASSRTRETIKRAFNTTEFEVLWALNEPEASDIAMRHQIDLLLVELNQPLAAAARTLNRLKGFNTSVPIVVLTEQKLADDDAIGGQVDVVVQEPLSASALAQIVESLIGTLSAESAQANQRDSNVGATLKDLERFQELLMPRPAQFDAPLPRLR